MSRYAALADYLRQQKAEMVPLSFADIERITRAKLPPSAHKHRPWWSNNPNNSVMTRVWLDAGFKSEQVDMAGQKLVFRRVSAPTVDARSSAATRVHPLYGALKGTVRVAPGVDLTAPADPDWANLAGN